MAYIMVDIEANGPVPSIYSMLSLGAVVVEPDLKRRFYTTFRPLNDNYNPDALKACKTTVEQSKSFEDPKVAMEKFDKWLNSLDQIGLIFISDNNGFDWQFVNWYFHNFLGRNPFGYSSTNLGSLYKGLAKNIKANFKGFRKLPHTHHALDDALSNADAMLRIAEHFKIPIY